MTWTASHFAQRLLLLTGLALVLAFALSRPELVVLAAVPAAWLAVAPRRREPDTVRIEFEFPSRAAEDDPIPVTVRATCPVAVDLMRLTLTPAPGLRGAAPLTVYAAATEHAALETALVASRWGRREIGHVTAECWTRGRLRHAVQLVKPRTDIAVYPRAAALRRLPHVGRISDRGAAGPDAGVISDHTPVLADPHSLQVGDDIDHASDRGRVDGVVAGIEADEVVAAKPDLVTPAQQQRDRWQRQHPRPVRLDQIHRTGPDRAHHPPVGKVQPVAELQVEIRRRTERPAGHERGLEEPVAALDDALGLRLTG